MLHMHSLWSDGQVLPEQAISAYKDAGYDFVSLTDHNRFQDNPDHWLPVSKSIKTKWPARYVHEKRFEAYMKRFGQTACLRKKGDKTEVRLRTYGEFKKMFDEPGEFLVLPGTEITTDVFGTGSKRSMHMNIIGIDSVIARAKNAWYVEKLANHTASSAMRETYSMSERLAAERGVKKAIYMLNHPHWPACDILAEDMIATPEITGFEICNNGARFAVPPQFRDGSFSESFWDVTLAHRVANNQDLLYAFASDDTHSYPNTGLASSALFADGYIMVKADELTQDSLFEAISRGDFYASSELDLDDVFFDSRRGSLEVSATPKKDETLKIRFITTKKGVPINPVSHVDVKDPKNSAKCLRSIPVYDQRVGATVKLVEGEKGTPVRASYTLQPDDLYVRARVESDQPSKGGERICHVKIRTAWTQPYRH